MQALTTETAVQVVGDAEKLQLFAAGSALVKRDSLSEWYTSTERATGESSTAITSIAYAKALQFHKDEFKRGHDEAATWLSPASSVYSVLDAVAVAQKKYTTKKVARRKSMAIAASWWKLVSSRMMQYEKVIDTLVSSHPEYSALVWGAMRFLFSVTLNHEELSTKIAQAFAEIGSVLPEVDFIAQKLYPTESINITLAHVYAQILEFCMRATKWYNKAETSPFKKVLSAVVKTWPLEFQDIRVNIDRQFRRLREQSAVAHQAETRDIHKKISDIRILLAQSSSIQQAFGSETTPLRVNPSIRESLPAIQERISLYLDSQTFDPHQTLKAATTMRDRRRARVGPGYSGVWTSAHLRDWISKPESAILQLRGSLLRAEESRDVALDLLQLLNSVSVPVIWYMGSSSVMDGETTSTVSVADILRSLIKQTIEQHSHALKNWNVNEAHFQACNTTDDWLQLFINILAQIPRIVLVVDAHQDIDDILRTISQFWDAVKRKNISTIIKILVLTYESTAGQLRNFPVLPTTVGAGRYPGGRASSRPSRVATRFPGQRSRMFRSLQAGPEVFKPYILQLIHAGRG